MRVPAAGTNVHFHVTGTRWGVANLQDGAAEVRPAFGAGETGMENADSHSVSGLDLVTAQPLVQPDRLQEPFGWRIDLVVQDVRGTTLEAPVGVKVFSGREHCQCYCAGSGSKSSGESLKMAADSRLPLVCLAGVVNYRGGRNPTEAMTPTVAEG